MTDWADYALERLKRQEEDKRRSDEKAQEGQRLKRAHGTPLWLEVRKIVEENIKQLNTKADKSIVTLRVTNNLILEAYLTSRSHRTLQAEFNEPIGTLEWRCDDKSGRWEIAVGDDGSPHFFRGLVPTTPASMAKQMLDSLLFG